MRSIIIFTLFFSMSSILLVYADDGETQNKIMLLSTQIDRIDDKIDMKVVTIESRIRDLNEKLANFSGDIIKVKGLQDKLSEKISETEKKKLELMKYENEFKLLDKRIELNQRDIQHIMKLVVGMEKDVSSSSKIIAWVTGIISVIAVIIGAFFSKIFLELYSTNKVLMEKFNMLKEQYGATEKGAIVSKPELKERGSHHE